MKPNQPLKIIFAGDISDKLKKETVSSLEKELKGKIVVVDVSEVLDIPKVHYNELMMELDRIEGNYLGWPLDNYGKQLKNIEERRYKIFKKIIRYNKKP
jgi:hypothetical protein